MLITGFHGNEIVDDDALYVHIVKYTSFDIEFCSVSFILNRTFVIKYIRTRMALK